MRCSNKPLCGWWKSRLNSQNSLLSYLASFVAEDTFSLIHFSDPETINLLAHQSQFSWMFLIMNEQDLWPTEDHVSHGKLQDASGVHSPLPLQCSTWRLHPFSHAGKPGSSKKSGGQVQEKACLWTTGKAARNPPRKPDLLTIWDTHPQMLSQTLPEPLLFYVISRNSKMRASLWSTVHGRHDSSVEKPFP